MMKKFNLLFYFIITLIIMEILLRLATTKDFLLQDLFISLSFSVVLAIIYFIICTSFQNKVNYFLSSFLLTLTGFIFFSQLIYYQIFKTFYSFYSVGNASQIFEFRTFIWTVISQKYIWILLFFLPTLLILAFGKKVLSFNKTTRKYKILLVSSIVVLYLIGLATIYSGDRGQNSAYDLYFQNRNPVLSFDKLGMVTTMRVDLQRLIFKWSPTLVTPDIPTFIPSEVDEIDTDVEYNIMEIDFNELISMEDNETVKEMHNYFANVEPTSKNEYTGKYKGYNLIHIVAESFSPYAIREDITPTLYKMANEGYNFTNFYVPSWDVSTSDGEYVTLVGLLPKKGVWSFTESAKIELPFVMGNQLKELNYKTVAYHNHTYTYYNRNLSHPNLGYDFIGVGNGLKVTDVWPASDLEMIEMTVPEYIENIPFHTYYLTVSGHMHYSFDGNNMARKNKIYVEDLPYSEQAQAYLGTQIELDKALEHLLEQLENAGIAERTLIALSADHYPYGLDDETIEEFIGHKAEENFELYESRFILYTKGMESVTIDKPSSSLDIIPTLSNLLGLEYDSRFLMGRDIFSDSEPLVIFNNKSFITEKGKYNSLTKEFILDDGADITEEYIDKISSIVESKFYYSAKILDFDYYNKIE
ncbi:MAG: LTA synthase family protein [Vulcanibacillus sp.]